MPSINNKVHLKHREVNYVVLRNPPQASERKTLKKLAIQATSIREGDRERMDGFISGH